MKPDAAIQRTRDARRRISASVDDDPVKMVKYYITMQERFVGRLQPGPEMLEVEPPRDEERQG